MHATLKCLARMLLTAGALSIADGVAARTNDTPCANIAGKRIRWIVPHSAGGGYDTYSRLIEPFFENALGAEIVVENISGAGGRIGARAISDAAPNGRTLGILNGSGLMVAALCGERGAPNPARDFTILARLTRNRAVWATGRNSPFKTMDDVLAEAERRPILFAVRDVGSSTFLNATVGAHILGMKMDFVAGYKGSRANTLAALRGDVDLVAHTFETIRPQVENGDVRPLLQISDEPVADHTSLKGVPLLGGEHGLAVRRARELGRDVDEARREATALYHLLGTGRLVVAPPNMAGDLSACLETALQKTLNDADFRKAAKEAKRSLDVSDGGTARAESEASVATAEKFIPIIQAKIKKLRE